MQNFPVEKLLGCRACIVPDEGDDMGVADYSQVELRLTAHYSEDPRMVKAYREGADIHQQTADLLGIDRQSAKTINFGILYGLSGWHLGQVLGIPKEDAQDIINNWFDKYIGVKRFKEAAEAHAQKYGYVKTMSGRRRRIPDVWSSNWKKRGHALRQSVNTIIQGSGADLLKYAMVKIWEKYKQGDKCKILSTVHDELLFSFKKETSTEIAADVKSIMENCIELRVPLLADMCVEENWWWGKMREKVKTIEDVPPLLRDKLNKMDFLEV